MKRLLLICYLSLIRLVVVAQFAPPAGQLGTTAIHKDSSVFVEWATNCSVVRGYQDISKTSLGYASTGDSSMALGKAGTNGVVSLGDGGYVTITFLNAISDKPGWDFAVFENSFSDTFLELAFVEVSSDGINYFRFPCTAYTQDTLQINGFGNTDATKIDNLAGKYRAMYGTPFDLQQLSLQSGLNINVITHVKIIDVVGCIQDTFARYDQYGNKINDPWNTPFPSSGFDLDAVGVIHSLPQEVKNVNTSLAFNIYPNPAKNFISVSLVTTNALQYKIVLTDILGKEIKTINFFQNNKQQNIRMDISELNSGIYFISVFTQTETTTQKLIVSND